jgi:GYF domain 2
MAAQLWWVQIDQAMVGPMAPSKLRALAGRRTIDPETLVSLDKVQWAPARTLKGLFEPADEKADAKPRQQAGAYSAGSVPRRAAARADREAGTEQPAGHVHDRPRADEVASRFPILRTRSGFLWNDTVAIYDSHMLKGRRYWRRLAVTEAMCHAAGEAELREQFHRESRIEFSDVLEVREKTASHKTGSSHFVVRSKDHRQIHFTLPVQQAGNPRAALSLSLADRYWIRAPRRGTWTKITEHALRKLEAAHQPKRKAPKRRTPIRSKFWGWALKLLGLAYWLAIASPLTDGLLEIHAPQLWILIWAPAPILIFIGYRLCQRRYQPGHTGDDRKPVLFLRPFDDDLATSLQPSGLLAELTGLRVGRLSGLHAADLMTQVIFNSNPVRLARMFFDYGADSSEESLVRFFESYGLVRAIGKPGDRLAVPGAARMELADDQWQQAILAELRKARAVVLQPGSTKGVHWEFEQIRERVEPGRLLLCLVSFLRNPQGYEEMSRVVRETLMLELPRVVPFLDRPAFVYFDRDWAPRLQELSYKCPVLWPVSANGADLGYTLKPFVRGMRGRKPLRPRTPRWTAGVATVFAKIAAVVLSLTLAIVPVGAVYFIFQSIGSFQKLDSSETTLRGRTVPYSLSIPASWVKAEAPGDDCEYLFKSPDGQLSVEVDARATRENISNIGEQLAKNADELNLFSMVQQESTRQVNVDGVEWTEARLHLRRKENGALFQQKARAFSDDHGTIVIVIAGVVEGDESNEAITEKILASVKLDSTTSDDRLVGRWESVDAPVRVIQEFSKDGQSKITFARITTKGTYKLDGDVIDWRGGGMTAKVKVKFSSSTEMELSNEAGQRVRYKKLR